ncbi:OmpA family protein [Vibrio sp. J383]|uniref:OmpA family protein n=1 Tax=Vibrio sp. J383 TaxID=2942997 RepID=UPI0020BE2225|nr:OmpA family protein [Vibrio sp. J383]UQV24791.1 OmpA family protein [Vibrio sp. J383]
MGHTDSKGSDISNQTLSEKRAKSVGDYLVNQQVPNGRFNTKGYGERYPVCENQPQNVERVTVV